MNFKKSYSYKKPLYKKENMYEALEECEGLITYAKKKAKIPHHVHREWMNDENYKNKVIEIKEKYHDQRKKSRKENYMKRVRPKKEAMLKALESSLGIVTKACKKVGIDNSTHNQWMRDDEEYKNNVHNIQNITLDFAEDHLLKLIEENNPSAIIFYLKTKGKKRGYIENNQVISNENEIIISKQPDIPAQPTDDKK